jgi:hypothetical protein
MRSMVMRIALVLAVIAVVVAGVALFGARAVSPMESARANLIGLWRSTEDAKFTREFRSDGTTYDAYEGSVVESDGRWILFTKNMPPEGYEVPLEDTVVYLAITEPESEPLYFRVTRAEVDALELIYLNRGGILSFERIIP